MIPVAAIDALLPQAQCRRCGFADCRAYAEALAAGEAALNRCPPGGAAGIRRLAHLLGQREVPLDPDCGAEQPRRVARIDAERCIGCTRCLDACPVDAIIGMAQRMHTVIEALCTGCELCIAPCPVDCIAALVLAGDPPWRDEDAGAARARHDARRARLARLARRVAAGTAQAERTAIERALQRARERAAARAGGSTERE